MSRNVAIPTRMYLCLTISSHIAGKSKNQSTPTHQARCTDA
jgi:hypothetical protein